MSIRTSSEREQRLEEWPESRIEREWNEIQRAKATCDPEGQQ
ncbi:hypothetical protein [Halopiger xanaduensis]|uniref:Uncharacterized protein n=1 Tax=Halopiger xanaduensis (strain DSM 18323 / JCM 14033 / SH-6) TaxID=797210 RepID=F8DEL5_HALXS|nr:hypothetical protein [Halopiger xanaduensis]AEH39452.1 hypothetical protein Halxa_0212 [Halopiger xanaduensis SH-6]